MMKKNILTIMLACAVGLPAGLHAQQGWTLRQCIDYAIENNVTIRQTANTADQSAIDVNTAKWARLPNLNARAGENFNWGRTGTRVKNDDGTEYQIFVNQSSNSTSFSASTNIPLFTGFELPNQYALSKLNLKAAVADLEKAREDLAINVASSYLQALFTYELNKIAIDQVVLTKEQVDRITRLNELGKASLAEVAEQKARLAQDEMNAVQADNNYRLALLDLSQLMELPSPEGFSLASPDESLNFSAITPPDEIYLNAAMNKPAILAAQYRLEGGEKSLRIAQSGYYPELSFDANLSSGYYSSIMGRSFGQQLNDNFSKTLGFSLSIPIFNRFATRNRVRKARIDQLNLSLQLDGVKKDLYKEIQQAWYNAVAAESKYNSSEVAVSANEESFRLMKEKFENGKATSIEYNEAKLNLTKAASDRVQAKYEYIFRTKILDFYKGIPIE